MNLTLCFQFFILFQKTHEKTHEFFGTETFETYEKTLEKKGLLSTQGLFNIENLKVAPESQKMKVRFESGFLL